MAGGRKKKLNAKQKAENQKHLEHRRLKEEEEATRPKSFNDPGPSSAPGYAKRQDDCCSAKNELRNSRVPAAASQNRDSKDLLASIQEELLSLKERMNNIELSSAPSCEHAPNSPEVVHTTGLAIVVDPDKKEGMEIESATDSAPKLVVDDYVRKVALPAREVNQLSRPSHMDLYDLYFRQATNLEYFTNYVVQVLVAKNKSTRKPFIKKIIRNHCHENLKKILEGLPEYKEYHRKPIDIQNFQAIAAEKKEELRKYINKLTLPDPPEPDPPNVEYFEDFDLEGPLVNLDFPNPFARITEEVQNDVPVFNAQPEVHELSLPRLSMLAALIGQKRNYKRVRPALTNSLIVDNTPKRFLGKFLNLMTSGFFFLGKLIMESLSPDEEVNRGNVFLFQDGDVGFWWAGVIILDWNEYLWQTVGGKQKHKSISCVNYMKTVGEGNIAYKAMLNLGPDGLAFTEQDQKNFQETIEKIKHKRCSTPQPEGLNDVVRRASSPDLIAF